MRVGQVMTRSVITVRVDATIAEAAELMKVHGVGFLPAMADDVVAGVVTDRDIVVRGLCGHANPFAISVRAIMSKKPVWCFEHDVLTDAADIMAENHVRRVVVLDAGKHLAGLLSIDDLAANLSSDRLLASVFRELSAA